MATNFWMCERCKHIGPTETFRRHEELKCPMCGETNDVFPEREFVCCECGNRAKQGPFFATQLDGVLFDAPSDPDPVEEKWEFHCKVVKEYDLDDREIRCGSTSYVQVL